MPTKSNSLTIILVNYNGWQWLDLTLTTLKKYYLDSSVNQVKVVVVDNGSTDDSVVKIKKKFGWCQLITLPKNLGFAAGNNVALKQVSTDFVMLLNSDVELTAKSNLDLLIDYLKDNPQTGVITPKLILPNGQLDWASHRGEPTPWASLTYFLGLEKRFPQIGFFSKYHLTTRHLNETHMVDAVSGAAMLMPTKAVKEVGLLDERFFMYAEDLDWCRRFRDHGWQIIYYPNCEIIHHKNKSGIGSSHQNTSSTSKKYFYQTMLQYFEKHYRHVLWMPWRLVLKLIIFYKQKGF